MKFKENVPDPLFNYYENRIEYLKETGRIGIKDFKNKTLNLLDDGGEAVYLVVEIPNGTASYNIMPDIINAIVSLEESLKIDAGKIRETEFINTYIKPTMPNYIRITQETYVQYAQHHKYNQVIRANYWPNYEDMRDWMEKACNLYKQKIEN